MTGTDSVQAIVECQMRLWIRLPPRGTLHARLHTLAYARRRVGETATRAHEIRAENE